MSQKTEILLWRGQKWKLREICERSLEFENYYLKEYRDFWVPKLSEESIILMALNKICDFDFQEDKEVFEALRSLREREDGIGGRADKILK